MKQSKERRRRRIQKQIPKVRRGRQILDGDTNEFEMDEDG